jgi:hypothetical protein
MIFPSITFERGRRFAFPTPVFIFLNQKYRLVAFLIILWRYWRNLLGWRLIAQRDGISVLKHGTDFVALTDLHLGYVVREWRSWRSEYLPNFSLEKKTVLDVGAGCGETAYFFLLSGAQMVIAIEPDPTAAKLLRYNVNRNNWNVKIIADRFRLEHLRLPHDFMKMDGEGCELLLLDCDVELKPCFIEAHSTDAALALTMKYPLSIVDKLPSGVMFLKTRS